MSQVIRQAVSALLAQHWGRPSEDLDDVASDALSKARVFREHPALDGMGFDPGDAGQQVRDGGEVDQRKLRQRRIDIDQHIEIAFRPRIAARTGTEQRKMPHAPGLQRRLPIGYRPDDAAAIRSLPAAISL